MLWRMVNTLNGALGLERARRSLFAIYCYFIKPSMAVMVLGQSRANSIQAPLTSFLPSSLLLSQDFSPSTLDHVTGMLNRLSPKHYVQQSTVYAERCRPGQPRLRSETQGGPAQAPGRQCGWAIAAGGRRDPRGLDTLCPNDASPEPSRTPMASLPASF